jgi:hypothetical protein
LMRTTVVTVAISKRRQDSPKYCLTPRRRARRKCARPLGRACRQQNQIRNSIDACWLQTRLPETAALHHRLLLKQAVPGLAISKKVLRLLSLRSACSASAILSGSSFCYPLDATANLEVSIRIVRILLEGSRDPSHRLCRAWSYPPGPRDPNVR